MTTPGWERGGMDSAIDVKQRITEHIAQVTRQYLENQRSGPGGVGRSADGSVEVTLDGLGDITEVTVHARDVPPEAARRLAVAFRQAWMDAGRRVALEVAKNSPVAGQPGMAELVQEQITARYGTTVESEAKRPTRPQTDDDDFGETSPLLHPGRNRAHP